VTDLVPVAERLRHSELAARIRETRLIAVLRRVEPTARLVSLVEELATDGVRVFEITFDAPSTAADLAACRTAVAAEGANRCFVGAGTLRTMAQLDSARGAGAEFGVSPVFDPAIVGAALANELPFIPGAYTPTEIDAAWSAGATFVKLFPASSAGPNHVRELRGPMPEIELVATGGVDANNARAFLDAGAVAVGIGSAIAGGTRDERRALVHIVRTPA